MYEGCLRTTFEDCKIMEATYPHPKNPPTIWDDLSAAVVSVIQDKFQGKYLEHLIADI